MEKWKWFLHQACEWWCSSALFPFHSADLGIGCQASSTLCYSHKTWTAQSHQTTWRSKVQQKYSHWNIIFKAPAAVNIIPVNVPSAEVREVTQLWEKTLNCLKSRREKKSPVGKTVLVLSVSCVYESLTASSSASLSNCQILRLRTNRRWENIEMNFKKPVVHSSRHNFCPFKIKVSTQHFVPEMK